MITREAWYREALEGAVQRLLEQARRNDLDALVAYYRLQERAQARDWEPVIDVYNAAHPKQGWGNIEVARDTLRDNIERSYRLDEPTEEVLEKVVRLLDRAARELGHLYYMNRGRKLWEKGLRLSWREAERYTREAAEVYLTLSEDERDEAGWPSYMEQWFL